MGGGGARKRTGVNKGEGRGGGQNRESWANVLFECPLIDTDSLICEIKINDVYEDFYEDKILLDFSD